MSLKTQEDIGAEVHKLDHFFRVATGRDEAALDGVRAATQAGFALTATPPVPGTPPSTRGLNR